MKITEVVYSKSRTLQLVQFEPTTIFYSMKAELEEGEDPKTVYAAIKKEVDELVAIDVEVLRGDSGKIVRQAAKEVLKKKESDPF